MNAFSALMMDALLKRLVDDYVSAADMFFVRRALRKKRESAAKQKKADAKTHLNQLLMLFESLSIILLIF